MITEIIDTPYLSDHLAANGFEVVYLNGSGVVHDLAGNELAGQDQTVIDLINAFDVTPFIRNEAKSRVKLVAARKSAEIYSFIDASTEEAIGLYRFAADLYLSILPAARNTLPARLANFKAVYDAAIAALADLDAITDLTALRNYDAENTPLWP